MMVLRDVFREASLLAVLLSFIVLLTALEKTILTVVIVLPDFFRIVVHAG